MLLDKDVEIARKGVELAYTELTLQDTKFQLGGANVKISQTE